MAAPRLICTILLASVLGLASTDADAEALSRADAAWESRADGEQDGRPRRAPIREAVSLYERALAEDPDSLQARWKLLRALYFAGGFASREEGEQREIFERANEVSEAGLEQLANGLAGGTRLDELGVGEVEPLLPGTQDARRDVARLYFWSAINRGGWSRTVGLLAAVRQGVANRLHRYTLITLALEPGYDEGGAYRLLGRLHAELPRVPFVSSWVDREQALPLIESAYELAPENPGNRLLLALTLLDLAPERRDEAAVLLDQVAQLTPRPSMRIEDLAMQRQAREQRIALGPDMDR